MPRNVIFNRFFEFFHNMNFFAVKIFFEDFEGLSANGCLIEADLG